MLRQSNGGGGRGTKSDFCRLSTGGKCWSVARAVTSPTGMGVQCCRGRRGLVTGLCSIKVAIPRGQKQGGLGAPAHDLVGYV